MVVEFKSIREDFPILQRKVHGKPLVYLDSAATSLKPTLVLDAEKAYYTHYTANVHRGIYEISEMATAEFEGARQFVCDFIRAKSTASIVFTRGTTEAINLVAYSWGRENIKQGDEIILTEMEHHSNIIPWQLLAKEKGATLRYIGLREDHTLDMEHYKKLLNDRTRLVSVTHVSNVLGTINPVKEIARQAHDNGSLVLVDSAQGAPHMALDVQDLDCDFLAFSGHKMLGPTGIGVLYGKEEILDGMNPFLGGGEMIRQVTLEGATWNDLPWKFEAGTPNIAGAIGLGAAIIYLRRLGMDTVREHEKRLTGYALKALRQMDGMETYGPLDLEKCGGVISFNYAGIHPHDLGTVLDHEGVAVRAGHHCAQPLMRRLCVPATARVSFYVYNTLEEIDTLVGALKKAKEFFGNGS